MRKINKITTLISIIISVFLIGCGSTADSAAEKEITTVENKEDSTSESQTTKESLETATIEETVLLDQDGIRITATALEEGWMGLDLKLLIENDSDKGLTFQVRNTSVNGYMVEPMMSEDVASGKKSNTEITFLTSGLKECGITTIANMQFAFHIFETDSWEDFLDTELIHIETSAAATYTQSIDDSGEILYEENGIKIVGKGLTSEDSFWGPAMMVYIENNSDKNITVQVRDTSVNGFMIEPSMSQDVLTGKKAISAITFFSSSLEENGITDIESIETSFHIFGMDSWEDSVDTEPITIHF